MTGGTHIASGMSLFAASLPEQIEERMKGLLKVIVPAVAMVAAPIAANATTPRPVDCGKAQSLGIGWTSKQVTKALGKPYSIEFDRTSMAYGWTDQDGRDHVRVAFDVDHRKVDARKAIAISGRCADKPLSGDLTQDPRLGSVPKIIELAGTAFHLAYVAENREKRMRFVEYVPAGQSLVNWRQMVAVFLHSDGSTPRSNLEIARSVAERTLTPHFREVFVSADATEAIAAQPTLREGGVEYQVARWKSHPAGVLATVFLARSYNSDGVERDDFVAQQEAGIGASVEKLKALPLITPPELMGNGALTLTRNGTEDSEVLVAPRE